MSATATLWWREGRWVRVDTPPAGPPDVADSWLVDGGRAVGLVRHERRFARTAGEDDAFFRAVRGAIPTTGRWFPRIESRAGEKYLLLRRAPTLRSSTVLHIPEARDPRVRPEVKGPDLAALGQLRAQAQEAGADDAILVDAAGHVVEAANAVLGWWEGENFMVPPTAGQLPSVTLAQTAELGVPVGRRAVTAEELRGLPVWAGSSLHGWTPVRGWVDGVGFQAAEAPSTVGVNARLWGRAERV